jgi:hypothetical protein
LSECCAQDGSNSYASLVVDQPEDDHHFVEFVRTLTQNNFQSHRFKTDKKTAGVFLETLSNLAYKGTKKTGEFVVLGFGTPNSFDYYNT